jgi:hypothetical protein
MLAGRRTDTGLAFGEEDPMANKDKGKEKPKKGKKGKKGK